MKRVSRSGKMAAAINHNEMRTDRERALLGDGVRYDICAHDPFYDSTPITFQAPFHLLVALQLTSYSSFYQIWGPNAPCVQPCLFPTVVRREGQNGAVD